MTATGCWLVAAPKAAYSEPGTVLGRAVGTGGCARAVVVQERVNAVVTVRTSNGAEASVVTANPCTGCHMPEPATWNWPAHVLSR